MAGEPILVVDDNPANLRLLRLLLAAESYEVRAAGDAGEALGVLEEVRDLGQALHSLIPGNKAAVDSYDQGSDAEAARPGSDNPVISWNVLTCHS